MARHRISDCLNDCLATPKGRYVRDASDRAFPDAGITDIKKLDLVLWQTR